jgi:hypothetical protein
MILPTHKIIPIVVSSAGTSPRNTSAPNVLITGTNAITRVARRVPINGYDLKSSVSPRISPTSPDIPSQNQR